MDHFLRNWLIFFILTACSISGWVYKIILCDFSSKKSVTNSIKKLIKLNQCCFICCIIVYFNFWMSLASGNFNWQLANMHKPHKNANVYVSSEHECPMPFMWSKDVKGCRIWQGKLYKLQILRYEINSWAGMCWRQTVENQRNTWDVSSRIRAISAPLLFFSQLFGLCWWWHLQIVPNSFSHLA